MTHVRMELVAALCTVALLSGTCPAGEGNGIRLATSGRIQYQMLQIVHTTVSSSQSNTNPDSLLNLAWEHSLRVRVTVKASFRDNMYALLSLRSTLANKLDEGLYGQLSSGALSRSSGLAEAKLVMDLGNPETRPLQLSAGVFEIKYNPEAHDLGEYLLASGSYPGVVYSGLDSTQLFGLHLRSTHMKHFTHHVFLTSELASDPMFDFSLAYVGEARIGKVFTLGAGIMFDRLIAVNEDNTTPKQFGVFDESTGDTVVITHRGIKAMGRFCFDPKAFFDTGPLGDEDLKLYAEAAVLGIQDQPVYYERIRERAPVMAGFNLPSHPAAACAMLPAVDLGRVMAAAVSDRGTHRRLSRTTARAFVDSLKNDKAAHAAVAAAGVVGGVATTLLQRALQRRMWLDVLAVEMEWYGSPHANNPETQGIPYSPQDEPGYGKQDDWKWAVSAARTIRDRFEIRARAASDHFRTANHTRQRTVDLDEWYWSLRFTVTF